MQSFTSRRLQSPHFRVWGVGRLGSVVNPNSVLFCCSCRDKCPRQQSPDGGALMLRAQGDLALNQRVSLDMVSTRQREAATCAFLLDQPEVRVHLEGRPCTDCGEQPLHSEQPASWIRWQEYGIAVVGVIQASVSCMPVIACLDGCCLC